MADSGDVQNNALKDALDQAIKSNDKARQAEIRREILQRNAALVQYQQLKEAQRREQDLYALLHPSEGGKTPAPFKGSQEEKALQDVERQAQDLEVILNPSRGGKTPAAMDEGSGEEYDGEESESERSEEEEEEGEEEEEEEEERGEEEGYPSEYELSVDRVLRTLATLRKKTSTTVLSATARQQAATNLIQHIMSPSFVKDFGEGPRAELLAHVTTYEDAARAHADELVTAQELAVAAEEQARRAFNASTIWKDDTLRGYYGVYYDLQDLRKSPPDADADADDP